jgi:hypothetical protein
MAQAIPAAGIIFVSKTRNMLSTAQHKTYQILCPKAFVAAILGRAVDRDESDTDDERAERPPLPRANVAIKHEHCTHCGSQNFQLGDGRKHRGIDALECRVRDKVYHEVYKGRDQHFGGVHDNEDDLAELPRRFWWRRRVRWGEVQRCHQADNHLHDLIHHQDTALVEFKFDHADSITPREHGRAVLKT